MLIYTLKAVIPVATLLGVLTMAQTAESDTSDRQFDNHTIKVSISPTQTQPLYVHYSKIQEPTGTETFCSASISVPLSAYPSLRLAARPADFASHIREQLDEWKVSKCSVVVWLNNDTGDDLLEEESCLSEEFRYDGDSVWSVSSETLCYDEMSMGC